MPDSGMPSPEARDGEAPDIAGTIDTTRRRPPGRSGWGTLGVVGVLALAGVLFTANARIAGGADGRQPQDFAHLVQAESDRVGELQVQVDQLQGEVDRLTDAGSGQMPGVDPEARDLTAFAAGRAGPGGPPMGRPGQRPASGLGDQRLPGGPPAGPASRDQQPVGRWG